MTKPATTITTSHTMRLRSRNNSESTANINHTSRRTTGRSVLGDVSNKRNAQSNVSNETVKERATKRTKPNPQCMVAASYGNSHNENPAEYENFSMKRNRHTETSSGLTEILEHSRQSSYPPKNDNKKRRVSDEYSVPYDESYTTSSVEGNRDPTEDDAHSREDRQEIDHQSYYAVPQEYRLHRTTYSRDLYKCSLAPMDIKDTEDVLMASDYVTDMFQHLYQRETATRPMTYMCEQRDINARMRAILIDWLIEVHMKFRLVTDTLYLCANIIDRYCNLVQVPRNKLQLVGVTALLIACKYEEIYPPEVRDCVYITDRAYQRQEVLAMEQDMLSRLRFKITVPTAFPFLQRFLSITDASILTNFAAHYYMERTLQEHDLLRYRPSLVAAASIALAINHPDIYKKEQNKRIKHPGLEGTKILLEYTGFKSSELLDCASVIARKIGEEPVTASKRQLVAVKRKYDNKKYQFVSTSVDLPCASHIPIDYLHITTIE